VSRNLNYSDILTGVFQEGDKYYAVKGLDKTIIEETGVTQLEKYENFHALKLEFGSELKGTEVFCFTYGPTAGGLTESIGFDVYTYGERILRVIPKPLYKNRNIKISGLNVSDALLRFERYNAVFSSSYSIAFLRCAERIVGLDVEQDVQLLRIVMLELERISHHLYVLGRLSEAASQNVATANLFALRETVLRLISKHFGHRYFFGINGLAAISRDVDVGGLGNEIKSLSREFMVLWDMLSESRIFVDRLQTTCIAKQPWMVGPALRAAGHNHDTRESDHSLPYKDVYFEVQTHGDGDSLGRAIVRANELLESAQIIQQITDKLKLVKKRRIILDASCDGGAICRLESPSGDLLILIKLSGGKLSNIYLRSPSKANLLGFVNGISSNVFTDFHFAWESFGFWVSELGDIL
jgi:Ni,Fe-hydrogenase III large subunit